jgi:hypothetical protein
MRSTLRVTDTIDNQYVSSEQFSDYLTLLINSIEIDMDLFRILKYIEGSGKEWLL